MIHDLYAAGVIRSSDIDAEQYFADRHGGRGAVEYVSHPGTAVDEEYAVRSGQSYQGGGPDSRVPVPLAEAR